MQITDLIHLLYLIGYFLIAGQGVFYLLCFARVFNQIPGKDFINIRKLADPILDSRLSLLYYSCLASGTISMVFVLSEGDPLAISFIPVSFLLLLADVILAKKFNIPLNTKIRGITRPTDREAYELQSEWLRWIRIRAIIVIAGFLLLLVYTSLK